MMVPFLAFYIAMAPMTGINGIYLDHLLNVGLLLVASYAFFWQNSSRSGRHGHFGSDFPRLFFATMLLQLVVVLGWLEHGFAGMDMYRMALYLIPVMTHVSLERMPVEELQRLLRLSAWGGGAAALFSTFVLAQFDSGLGKFKPRVAEWLLGSNHLSFYLILSFVVPFAFWRMSQGKEWYSGLVLPFIHFSKSHLALYSAVLLSFALFHRRRWAGLAWFASGAAVVGGLLYSFSSQITASLPASLEKSLGNMLVGVRLAGDAIAAGHGLDIYTMLTDVGGGTRTMIYQTFFDNLPDLWVFGAGADGAKRLFEGLDFHSVYFYLISNYGIFSVACVLSYLFALRMPGASPLGKAVFRGTLAYVLLRISLITIDPVRIMLMFSLFSIAAARLNVEERYAH